MLVSCFLVITCWTSITGGNAIPVPVSESQLEENSVDTNVGPSLLVRLRDATRITGLGATGETADTAGGIPFDGSEGSVLPGHKRSAPAETNLSQQPAAFVVAKDLSGAELAQLLRGVINQDGTAIPAGVQCSGQPVNQAAGASASSYSPYASLECSANVIPNVTDEANTRGLCPWTYVENVDPNRYQLAH